MVSFQNKLVAEAIGTFCLVFAGTTAIIVDRSGAVSPLGVSLTFGLVVFAMIASLGNVSGAHINPAVTIGFYCAKRFSGRLVVPYILSQCCGAILASVVVHLLFPTDASLGTTIPSGSAVQSWMLEVLLTAMLMFVILGVSTGSREQGGTAGLAIGAVVALEALIGGPISGASMNPARSLAPAIVSLDLDCVWIYLTAPFVGAVLGVFVFRCVHGPCSDELQGTT
jgi:aquaporin Z